jgi:POT family proton-dependent oligopeptide transporter
MVAPPTPQKDTLFGHPAGLFTLFFAEMWERFSYYGMRALLVFYMIKGFLGFNDGEAYAVYGAYTALVYMTPFFGGMLADRLIGARRAVIFGGVLMALGQALLMLPGLALLIRPDLDGQALSVTVNQISYYAALALLIAGNGFFKPNISAIVGSLYEKHAQKRDGGFTIFYMGINLGAAMSPLLCGYVGETYGWHWGFGLAAAGMLAGLIVFTAPRRVAQLVIGVGALVTAVGLVSLPVGLFTRSVNVFVSLALLGAAVVSIMALEHGGLPREAGAPPSLARLRRRLLGVLPVEWAVYLGTLLMVPVFLLLVSGFAPTGGNSWTIIPESVIAPLKENPSDAVQVAVVFLTEVSKPAGLILFLAGLIAFGYLGFEAVRLDTIPRQRMYVVFILTFFSLLFWAFFEQAGSSVNNFTDRNVDRVYDGAAVHVITEADVGKTINMQPTQEQLGFRNGDALFTIATLDTLRKDNEKDPSFTIDWQVVPDNAGMRVANREDEVPASLFQAANPIFIMTFGLVFTALWAFLAARGWEPSTPLKFAIGLLQLGLGFGAFWVGAQMADERGMVAVVWLLLGYLLQTTGELCLSPVGLSMVTRLTPQRLVATMMGAWFLATAFSQFLAAIIAQFTRFGGEGDGGELKLPVPSETVHIYGNVFGQIAIAAMISAVVCFLLVPLLKRWMHEGD